MSNEAESNTTINEKHFRRLSTPRVLLILLGVIIIILAFYIDKLGFGTSGSFGVGQLLLTLVGLILSLTGVIGRRIIDLYRTIAIILLNTLVLLAIMELFAIVIARSNQVAESKRIEDLPYYAAQDWTDVYWHEAKLAESYRYKAFTGWQHIPFLGEMVNIDQEGIRKTPGAECSEGAYTIYTFGGSTMFGWGSPDWGTIAAYLQMELDKLIEKPVCVINLAEDGFVSTQSVIALMLRLQSKQVPDVVIFYDGINDIHAAYETGQANNHVTLSKIAARFDQRESPLISWLKGSRLYAIFLKVVGRFISVGYDKNLNIVNYRAMDIDTNILGDSIVDTYLENYNIVGSLSQQYGFDYFFFFQPHLAVSEKPLTRDENNFRSLIDPALMDLAINVYGDIKLTAKDYEYLWYLNNVFNEESNQIWIDDVGHVTPEGNQIIAKEIVSIIWDYIEE